MGCPHEPEVRRVLLGELDAESTRRVMDHIRGCDDCRQRLTFHTDVPTAARSGRSVRAADAPSGSSTSDSGGTPESESVRYQRFTWEDVAASPERRRPRLMRGIALILMVIGVATFITRKRGENEARDPLDAADRAVAAAGAPLVAHPAGALERWPRVLRLLAPSPFEHVTLRASQAGAPVWERTIRRDEPGVIVGPELPPERRGEHAVVPVHVPFPARGELEGDRTRPYALRVIAPDGSSGPPAEVRLPGDS